MVNRCIFFIAAAFLLVLSACGGGESGHDAPFVASITTSTDSISWKFDELAPFVCDNVDFFLIVVKNEKGIPLRDVGLTISNPLASPNDTVIQLYDGDPRHGGSTEDTPFSVKTDENGTYYFYFTYCGGGGVEYKSDFLISSGSLSKSVTFEVTKTTGT